MRRYLSIILLLTSIGYVHAGIRGNKELQIKTDNDFFVPFGNTDRYYTFGQKFIFRYREEKYHHFFQVPANLLALPDHQTIIRFEIGQEAYTPGNYENNLYSNYDRPFAGWTYFATSISYVFGHQIIRIGADAGVLGPASYAGQVQNYFHQQIINNAPLTGWQYQVENRVGVNLQATYHRSVATTKLADITWDNSAMAGSEAIYIKSGGTLRLGIFNPVGQTISYNTSITSGSFKQELFVALSADLKLTGYNATLQQSEGQKFFYQNKEVNNLTSNYSISINYNAKNFGIYYAYYVIGGDLENLRRHRYGSINLIFRL